MPCCLSLLPTQRESSVHTMPCRRPSLASFIHPYIHPYIHPSGDCVLAWSSPRSCGGGGKVVCVYDFPVAAMMRRRRLSKNIRCASTDDNMIYCRLWRLSEKKYEKGEEATRPKKGGWLESSYDTRRVCDGGPHRPIPFPVG